MLVNKNLVSVNYNTASASKKKEVEEDKKTLNASNNAKTNQTNDKTNDTIADKVSGLDLIANYNRMQIDKNKSADTIKTLAQYGIKFDDPGLDIKNNITYSYSPDGTLTISGIEGRDKNKPMTMALEKGSSIKKIVIKNSTNLNVSSQNGSTVALDIPTCTNVCRTGKTGRIFADAKAQENYKTLKSAGITLEPANVDALANLKYSKLSDGSVQLSNLSGTSSTPIKLTMEKKDGIKSVSISDSSYVNTNIKSGLLNVAIDSCTGVGSSAQIKAEANLKTLKDAGISINSTDVKMINDISYSKDEKGNVTLKGLKGTANQPLDIYVDSSKAKSVNIDFSENVVFHRAEKINVKTGLYCSNVKTVEKLAEEKIAQLEKLGVSITATKCEDISNIKISKNSDGKYTLSNIKDANLIIKSKDGVKGITISDSKNFNASYEKGSNLLIGNNCSAFNSELYKGTSVMSYPVVSSPGSKTVINPSRIKNGVSSKETIKDVPRGYTPDDYYRNVDGINPDYYQGILKVRSNDNFVFYYIPTYDNMTSIYNGTLSSSPDDALNLDANKQSTVTLASTGGARGKAPEPTYRTSVKTEKKEDLVKKVADVVNAYIASGGTVTVTEDDGGHIPDQDCEP